VIAYPALDLLGGEVVQLVGGRPESRAVSLPDPAAVARRWVDAGFSALHVVDLDAALGQGDNRAAIAALITAVAIPVHVGGGLRETVDVEWALGVGAARAIVGTRAVRDRQWLAEVAAAHPGRLVVAADCRGGEVVTHGWRESAGGSVHALVAALGELPLAAVLVTDVRREGQMVGVDATLFRALVETSAHPLLAAGGIRDAADLAALEAAGVAGAVLGMALYTSALDAAQIAHQYRQPPRPEELTA
jgi:phosphoribosylformimino-5-aminoimidazole carboxamide ribotide isomerase